MGAHSSFNSRINPDEYSRSNFQAPTNTEIVNNIIGSLNSSQKEPAKDAMGIEATKGLFAAIFNNITRSGSFLFGTLNALNQLIFHDNIYAGITIFFGALLSFMYWLLIGNVIRVGECRFFLENRIYHRSKVERILYLYKIRRIKNAAIIMLKKTIYIGLWMFTVIGGIIKAYSYRMVPYIAAENPDVDHKKVFLLSAQMMDGNKWDAFKLDLSFLLWNIWNICTFGFLSYLFVNPYKTATDAELYIVLRQNAIDNQFEYSEYLNDKYLTIVPESIATEQYPVSLFSIRVHRKSKWLTVDYHRNYSVFSLIVMFFAFSLAGWIWEVLLYLYTDGMFVNRGFLFGPWLPVYGCGSILILLLLKKFIDKPVLTFFLAVAICGVVEYSTGWYLETFQGLKWWDYSGYLFNLQGRICLERLILFGLGGCTGIYFIAPVLDNLLSKIPDKEKKVICILLVALFSTDVIYSTKHPNVGKDITSPVTASQKISAD